MRFGFSDVWWPSLANSLDWLQSLGCDCVRFGVGLPLDGNADPIYEELVGREMRPYMVLGGWNPAPAPDVYGRMVAPFADRYRKAALCLWNEPNYHSEENPNPLPVENAIALNLAGASAAKQAYHDARVLYSPVGPSGDWEHYFERLYEALPEGDVAMHIYPGGDMRDRLGRVEDAYKLGAKYGRVHVTEIDMAAPWLTDDPDAPKLAGKAYELLEDLGANTLIYHSIANHRREAAELKRAAN